MTDPDQTALANARERLRQSPEYRSRSGRFAEGGGSDFTEHPRPHLVTFRQDVTIILQRGRRRADGRGFEPDGAAEELRYRAGEIVQRPAGIWKITVKHGTADFEKDFEPPSARGDDAPVL